ncbi:uncharacterized protein [Coffea arabica]|uniref:Retrotransposon gag domain-containing protein n=1 Tax=Coffea arabica TaxID=13443 RepID=A0ABM4X5G6_COFAR
MANVQTQRELATPELNQQPLYITFPNLNDNTLFELKSGLIHLLPSFRGLQGEEPYKHLQEFDVVCNSMKPPKIIEEQIKMRAFPFSLKDSVKDWLYYLPPDSITTWDQLEKKFFDKYFPTSRAASLRKEICGNASQAKVYGICAAMGHSTEMYLLIQEASVEQMQAMQSQMAIAINSLESQVYEKLPSQPELNLKNVSAMTLRSGKEIQGLELVILKDKNEDRIEKEFEEEGMRKANPKQVPKYVKFLKNLGINKKKLRGDEHIVVGENVLMILQRKLLSKCRDPGSLKEVGIIIQLTDHAFAYSDGVVENVLMQVDGLIFSVDFYVLYMDDRSAPNSSSIILGRSFLSTAQTKIDVSKGTLTMEFDGEIVHFNIFDTIKHPVNSNSVFVIHVTNLSVQEFSEFACRGKFKVAANKYYGMKAIYEVKISRKLRKNVALNDYVDPGGRPPITRKIELHPN